MYGRITHANQDVVILIPQHSEATPISHTTRDRTSEITKQQQIQTINEMILKDDSSIHFGLWLAPIEFYSDQTIHTHTGTGSVVQTMNGKKSEKIVIVFHWKIFNSIKTTKKNA